MLPAGSQTGPPVVAGTADFDGRGSNHTAEGGRPAPEPQGSPRGVRAVPNTFPIDFPEDSLRDGGPDRRKDIGSPVDMLVNTVARMQKDIATLRKENPILRTPAIPLVVRPPGGRRSQQRKVPQFDGTTIWEQYRQYQYAIARSNGWDNDTAALQLFSQSGGRRAECCSLSTAIAMAVSVRIGGRTNGPLWIAGSTGRLPGDSFKEDPAIFATALETLAVKAFGDMGQTARLRLIQDRFIASHSNCDLRRHLGQCITRDQRRS